jgi:hypothetical protein
MSLRDFEKLASTLLVKMSARGASLLAALIFSGRCCFAFAQASRVPDIFKPASTPAESIHRLSLLVLIITALIFVVVFSLLV